VTKITSSVPVLGRRQRNRFLLAEEGLMCPIPSLIHYSMAVDNGAAYLLCTCNGCNVIWLSSWLAVADTAEDVAEL
jgi:hypothetical protein